MAIIGSMALDWIAPVATGTVGVAEIIFTWLTGKQARDDARQTAREARLQQRLENAYIELLDMAERVGHWAQSAYPFFDTNPPQPVPSLPSLEQQARTEALVRAFGSDKVRERMESWRTVVRQMLSAARLIYMGPIPGLDKPIHLDARRKFDLELRPQERSARSALGSQVAVVAATRRYG